MSATILYKQAKPEGEKLNVSTPSEFIELIEKAFGKFQTELSIKVNKLLNNIASNKLDALLEVVAAAKEIDKHYPPRNHDLNALVVALAELEEY